MTDPAQIQQLAELLVAAQQSSKFRLSMGEQIGVQLHQVGRDTTKPEDFLSGFGGFSHSE
jgi:hypothetical protein